MKKYNPVQLVSLLFLGMLLMSCSPKAVLPVSHPEKVKPLSEKEQLEKQQYFSEAMRAYELRNWRTAHTLFCKTIEIDPGCDACFYELANVHYHSGYLQNALSLSQSAVRLDSTNFWYRVQLAQIYSSARAYREAVSEYHSLLEVRPGMEDLYFDLSTLYIRMGELDSAMLVLDAADRKFGLSEQSSVARYEILKAQKEEQKALVSLIALVEAFPDARYYSLLGEQYSSMQKDTLALWAYAQSLLLDPDYTPALFGEADFYRRNGHFDRFFTKLYALYENKNVEMEYKAEYLSMLMQITKFAPTFFRQMDTLFTALRTPPDSLTEPLYATYLLQTGRSDSAAVVLKTNLQHNADNIGAWHQYLMLEYYGTAWDTLSKYAEAAHARFPDVAGFISMKAVSLWQTGQEAGAIVWFEKALPLLQDSPEQVVQTCAFLGDLYYTENKPKKAYEYYDKALAIDNGYVPVLNNYAYFLSEENRQLNKAYTMSKKAIEAEPDNATYLDTFGWILFKMGKHIEAKAIFRHAMIYGGNESAVILDHYGDVLHALGENDTAVIYWELSVQKEPNPEVAEKIKNVQNN
jgi:tetratricopeptide (TPR) repeat protein